MRRRDPHRSSLPIGIAASVMVAASLITVAATRALVALPAMTAGAGQPLVSWHQPAGRHDIDRPGPARRATTTASHHRAARPGAASAASFEPSWVQHSRVHGPPLLRHPS